MNLALSALVEQLKVRTQAQKENLKTLQWFRHNANARRGLPAQPDESVPTDSGALLAGVINAFTTRQEAGSSRGGEVGQSSDTTAGPKNPPDTSPQATDGRRSDQTTVGSSQAAARESSGGASQQTAGSSQQTEAGGGVEASEGSGGGGSGDPGSLRRTIAAAAIGAASTALLGGGGVFLTNYLFGGDEERVEERVEIRDGEYPLLDWLEEHGYHLPRE